MGRSEGQGNGRLSGAHDSPKRYAGAREESLQGTPRTNERPSLQDGNGLLHIAARKNRPKIAHYLIENRIDIELRNKVSHCIEAQ